MSDEDDQGEDDEQLHDEDGAESDGGPSSVTTAAMQPLGAPPGDFVDSGDTPHQSDMGFDAGDTPRCPAVPKMPAITDSADGGARRLDFGPDREPQPPAPRRCAHHGVPAKCPLLDDAA